MNKKVILTSALAVLATNLAIASQNQGISNPEAKSPPVGTKLAYGCIGSGHGQFQGKVSCEGRVVGGCEASPNSCQGASKNCQGQCEGQCGGTSPQDENCGGSCQGAPCSPCGGDCSGY